MGENPFLMHFWCFFGHISVTFLNFGLKQCSLKPNTLQKLHVLEKSGSDCTVEARPLFLRLGRLFDSFCVIPQYDTVMQWYEWLGSLDRMCDWYSYLKLTIFFSKFFSQKVFSIFFQKKSFFSKRFS